MKKLKDLCRNSEHLRKAIWTLGACCLALIYVVYGLFRESLDASLLYLDIPSNEIVERIDISLFKITFITNSSEYVSWNEMSIILTAALGIGFLMLLIFLGIYMNPPDSQEKETEKTENMD